MIKKSFSISRVFDTTSEQLYDAHTLLHHLKQWWGSSGFELSVCSLDLRPGGLFHYGMQTNDGYEMWGRFVFHKIIPNQQLTYTASFSDQYKGISRHPLLETWPMETLNNLTFNNVKKGAELSLISTAINCSENEQDTFLTNFENIRLGYTGTLDQLELYLEQQNS